MEDVTIASFADDAATSTTGSEIKEAGVKLQRLSVTAIKLTKKWRIGINMTKLLNIIFVNLRIYRQIPIISNSLLILHVSTGKYLCITLNMGLKWKEYVKKSKY